MLTPANLGFGNVGVARRTVRTLTPSPSSRNFGNVQIGNGQQLTGDEAVFSLRESKADSEDARQEEGGRGLSDVGNLAHTFVQRPGAIRQYLLLFGQLILEMQRFNWELSRMAIDYQQVMERSVAEFSDLIRQRRKLDDKIARLQKTVHWCARQLCDSSPQSAVAAPVADAEDGPIGFTEAVRQVLLTYRIWLSPVQVRDLLPTIGFDTKTYHEPLPSIHVILKRLVPTGEVIQAKPSSGGSAYIWASAVEETNYVATDSSLNSAHRSLVSG